MRGRFVLLCLFALNLAVLQNAQEFNGDTLSSELNKLADSIGWSFLQGEYNKLGYKETKIDGEKQVDEIAGKIGRRMIEVDNALKKLKEAVEEDQMSSADVPQDCCVDGDYQESIRFRTQVSEHHLCYSKPDYAEQKYLRFPSNNVLSAMKSNLDVKHLQFQYIANGFGLFINYPATKLTDCDTYDPRFRPFYVSTTTAVPRDVVVALDISNSMRGEKLNEARRAVLTVMETLSVKDNFGVVVFNDEAKTLDGCYENQLVPATSTTKKKFKDFLSSQSGDGGADFDAALRKAFMYFKANSSVERNSRDQILLFLTGGENIKGSPLETIRDQNEALQNRVVIHTFGIGTEMGIAERELLKNMAEQKMNNNSYGYVKIGKPVFPENLKSLREAMGTYYDYFSVPISTHPTYTQPYKDFFTNEKIITGCLPFAINNAFSGVVCADILLSELVAEILYIKQEELSYAFIIDGDERTIVHPLLPDPRDVKATDQDINNIYNFETSGDVFQIIDSMKKSSKGQKNLVTSIIEGRGEKYLDGSTKITLKAVYYWTPIVAPGSNLSLCIVVEQNNTVADIDFTPQPSSGDFLYHRWDLNQWPAPFCRHFNRYATQAKCTVKLTPDAFTEAYSYTGVKETEVRVKQYKDYLSGDIFTNPGLKASAVKSIRLTYPIEKFWTTISRKEAPYLVWRYVATQNGVMRNYPGIRLTDDYDYKLRPWYHRTVAQKLLNVVSAPYEDAWGAGKVISLTKTVSTRGATHERKIEAILGTDLSIYYFNQLLEDKYPICANKTSYNCIVIDNSGFLVMHPHFIETKSLKGQVHIAYLEGRISRSLIKKGIMYRQPCRDTGNKKDQFTYRVKLGGTELNGIVDSEEGYQLRPVSGSNVFLILKHKHKNDEDKCCNVEYFRDPSSVQCGTGQCTCLCYTDLSFNDCKNQYEIMGGFVPCNSQLPTLRSVSTPEEDLVSNLPTCFPTNCACRKTERECFRTSGCSWCTSDTHGDLVDGFCDLKELCPYQQCLKDECSGKCCGSECNSPPPPPEPGFYIGVSVGAGLFVIVLIIVVVLIIRKQRNRGTDDTYLDPTYDNQKCKDKEDYNTMPNYYVAELSAHSEESINTNTS
nr:VWFA and cache domain-containing protein 1 [Crassostrea gigas]XP_034337496.1 VWFA and cache domain-containing protein 1 [Crassostrea gigas]XP_034337917.1 VWFA and cache domain-containing protein 1 [Crassostrea gigas]